MKKRPAARYSLKVYSPTAPVEHLPSIYDNKGEARTKARRMMDKDASIRVRPVIAEDDNS